MIGSVVLTQYQCVTDRQTDRIAINITLCIAVLCSRAIKIVTVD